MKSAIIFLNLLAVVISAPEGKKTSLQVDCPADWTDAYELGCFYFGTKLVPTWNAAQEYCQGLAEGAGLAEIPNEETQQAIHDQIQNLGGSYWWLGASDSEEEGQWKWTHSGVSLDFTDWGSGEPSGANHDGVEEDCLAMFRNHLGSKWNDINCEGKFEYYQITKAICQKFV